MEVEQINIEDEYKALKNEDNNSDHTIRKVNSEKKITNGILKKERTRKASNFCKKDGQTQNVKCQNGIPKRGSYFFFLNKQNNSIADSRMRV